MDKVKEALHIGRSHNKSSKTQRADALSKDSNTSAQNVSPRPSHNSELSAMTPSERLKYLQEYEHAEKHGAPKKGGFLEKLIARGNRATEEELRREMQERNERW